ncbi:DinB family protein [Brevibacillus sp. M2.1A]|uniref:DinB family protein n=1 Tax=Brevibacillus sp. M2.1A TaxID=2738980 RepID=UPI00156ACFFE|nr:DinB family protein [Brevibacillus sp. M2.1A]MCC8438277.1 DinB family protein [Brevibacillus sp. M2.1A]
MKMLFQYNWQVRDEWMEWCKQLPPEELLRKRTGGAGTILYTLFHIADVEYSWLRGVQGRPDVQVTFEAYKTLEKVKELSDAWRVELRDFIEKWSDERENEPVKVEWDNEIHTKGELLRHVIAHEIHHMGQLSIWARELGITPVSANVIGRGLTGS